MLSTLLPNVSWLEIWQASLETGIMLGVSLAFTTIMGLPLGILLFITSDKQILQQVWLYRVLSLVVNLFRSVPFVILLIVLIPFTEILVGTSLGVAGAIVPLVIGITPFFARLVEISLREVDAGLIEATTAMGATKLQVIIHTLIPESLGGIMAGITGSSITLVSYTAMSGLIGGGGLGDLAVRYGYQRYQPDVMVVTVILLLILVQILQLVGDRLVSYFSHK